METTHRHEKSTTSQLPPPPILETPQPVPTPFPTPSAQPGEPYIRRVTEIYKDRAPSGFQEMRQADRGVLPAKSRPSTLPIRKKRLWEGNRWHDLLVYISLTVSMIALIGIGHDRSLWAEAVTHANETLPAIVGLSPHLLFFQLITCRQQTCRAQLFKSLPSFCSCLFALPIPPELARSGLAMGVDTFEVPSKTRCAIQIGQDRWLIAVPASLNTGGLWGWGKEDVEIKLAESVMDIRVKTGVQDVAARGERRSTLRIGDIEMLNCTFAGDALFAKAWYSQVYHPIHSSPTLTTKSTDIATLTVTSTITATSSTRSSVAVRESDDQFRSSLLSRLAEHELETETSRREWRRRKKDLMARESDLTVREEELRRRENWVLDEVR